MIESFDSQSINPDRLELPAEKSKAAGTWTGIAEVLSSSLFEVGVWEHGSGASEDRFGDEVFVVLEGKGTVTCQNGGVIDLKPGVVGILHEEDVTTWEVTEPIKKIWITRT